MSSNRAVCDASVGTGGLSEDDILKSLGLTVPWVPEEPSALWVPSQSPMSVEVAGVISNSDFFEADSYLENLGHGLRKSYERSLGFSS